MFYQVLKLAVLVPVAVFCAGCAGKAVGALVAGNSLPPTLVVGF